MNRTNAYILEYEQKLDDIKSIGKVYRHSKSGARVCVILNEDDNKVFHIGFRTPPSDNTGVAHIIEHTVLCGSEKFPVKDPFMELAKGSLNTFLNAMTYPDKTLYPVASCNNKDFQNLMNVYLDAVFYPNIYKKEEIFCQEGWHYDIADPSDELAINGIVYNEMKGAFSSPEQQLSRRISHNLFPDNAYGNESGGDPDYIPELTYEQFLDFHRTYYHPANSYIYLYGDIDEQERLDWMDREYLSHFDKIEVDSMIRRQDAFGGAREITEEYSISQAEKMEDNTYLTYNAVTNSLLDVEECMAFQVIETVLLSAPGAPLKQALIDAGIGKDILSSYGSHYLQPYLSIIAKNANAADLDKFKTIIQDTLEQIVKEGLNKTSVLAAINAQEFSYREGDFGSYPKGLLYGIQAMGGWLHDDEKAFLYFEGNKYFEILKEKNGSGYYEELIRKYLLDSKHLLIYTMIPKKGMNAEKEQELKNKLSVRKENFSKADIDAMISMKEKLRIFQETEDTEEALASIPVLQRSDIKKEAEGFANKEKVLDGTDTLFHEVNTNKIAYIKMLFDLPEIEAEKLPYLGILATVLGYIDTDRHSLLELSNEINCHTGGITTSLKSFTTKNDTDTYRPMFSFDAKLLYPEFGTMFSLCQEIIQESKLSDTKRLYEILQEIRSRLQMRINSSGHAVTIGRARSYYSQSAYFTEATEGIRYFEAVKELCDSFEDRKEEMVRNLKELTASIFVKENLFLSITADEEGFNAMKEAFPAFKIRLKTGVKAAGKPMIYPVKQLNEGFTYGGQVQYVSRVGNYCKAGFSQNGALRVLGNILGSEYMYNQVRVKGGAYGGMCGFASLTGEAYFTSYRDPHLKQTDEIYSKAYEFVESFEATEEEMTKYIIGTMSMVDTPLTPSQKGSRSFAAYMSGLTLEEVQKDRDEILSADAKDIRACAALVKSIYEADNLCVLGNENKVQEHKDMFKEVRALI